MALILKNTVYIHTPKCGGQWVRRELAKQVKRGYIERIDEDPSYHGIPSQQKIGHRRVFVGVRHPATWLRSYWAHRCREGWKKHRHVESDWPYELMNTALDQFRSDTFGEFVEGVYSSEAPDVVGYLFTTFVNVGAVQPAFIHCEHLASGLMKLCNAEAAFYFDRDDFDDEPENASEDLPEISKKVLDLIWKHEGPFFKMFGYIREPRGTLVADVQR